MNNKEIKAYFNKEIAPLTLLKFKKKLKKGELFPFNTSMEIIKKIVVQTNEAEKLNAQTAKDIIALLRTGKVSIADAKDLMSMLKDKAEIDELPVLLKKLEELEKKN